MIMFVLLGVAEIMQALVGLLPTFEGYPAGVYDAFEYMGGYWGMFDILFPMDVLGIVIVFILTVEGIFLGYKIAMKIWGLIPFNSKQ